MSELPIAALVGASFDAVIFDLDGTLIDSYVAMIRSYERWAQEFKIDLDLLPSHLGMPSAAVCEALLPPELVEAAAERIEVLEVTDTEGIIALPGALEALQELPRNRVAIATSCTADLMRARVTAAGLPFPDVIVTRDQVAEGKPSPDSFLRAATLLGFDPARTLVVEDAPAGIAAARAAGCMVLGIASSQPAENLAADAVVADLSEVAWQVADDGVVTLQTTTV